MWRLAGKQKDLGSIHFGSPLSSKIVVYGHTINEALKKLTRLATLMQSHLNNRKANFTPSLSQNIKHASWTVTDITGKWHILARKQPLLLISTKFKETSVSVAIVNVWMNTNKQKKNQSCG